MALNLSIQSDPIIVRNEEQGPTFFQQSSPDQNMPHFPFNSGMMANAQYRDYPPPPHEQSVPVYDYHQGDNEPQRMVPSRVFEAPPTSWLGLSIFSCLFCCWPLGLAAIIFSVRSNDQRGLQNYQKARANSRTALKLNIAAIVTGTAVLVVVIVLYTLKLAQNT